MLSPVRFWKSNKVVSFFSRGFLSLSFIFEFLIQPPSFLLTWQKFQVGCIMTAVVKLVQNQAHLFRSSPRFFKIPRWPPRVSHCLFYSKDSNGCHAPCMTFPRIFKLLLKFSPNCLFTFYTFSGSLDGSCPNSSTAVTSFHSKVHYFSTLMKEITIYWEAEEQYRLKFSH